MVMRSLFFILFLLLRLEAIEDYKVLAGCATFENQTYKLMRSFTKADQTVYWGIHLKTLEPKLFTKATKVSCPPNRYDNLRKASLVNASNPLNRGITQAKAKGYAITIDMCPSSKKGFEQAFYEHLTTLDANLPVAVSITGRWIKAHKKSFEHLIKMHKEKKLSISWMNHGMNHPYERGVAVKHNFINLPNIDFDYEVQALEKILLKAGFAPSAFYRFAGLVSNEKALHRLVNYYGLIPIGSQSWLAKSEPIIEGSIVLLHGNKNEPKGIDLAYKMIKKTDHIVSLEHLLR